MLVENSLPFRFNRIKSLHVNVYTDLLFDKKSNCASVITIEKLKTILE